MKARRVQNPHHPDARQGMAQLAATPAEAYCYLDDGLDGGWTHRTLFVCHRAKQARAIGAATGGTVCYRAPVAVPAVVVSEILVDAENVDQYLAP